MALEVLLRSAALWKVPIGYLLHRQEDNRLRTVWRLHQSRVPRERALMVLGASTAEAVFWLPDRETSTLLAKAFARGTPELLNLALNKACYAHQVVVFEHAKRSGHLADTALLFSWPSCLAPDSVREDNRLALAAERIPLFSSELSEFLPPDTLDERFGRWLAENVAIYRFQYTINDWIRLRTKQFLAGRRTLVLKYRPGWAGKRALEQDTQRLDQFRLVAAELRSRSAEASTLGLLLSMMRREGVRVLVVEAPWSPPVSAAMAPVAEDYRVTMERAVAEHGAQFYDPNPHVRLGREHFSDTYHVNSAGARIYLKAIAERLTGS